MTQVDKHGRFVTRTTTLVEQEQRADLTKQQEKLDKNSADAGKDKT